MANTTLKSLPNNRLNLCFDKSIFMQDNFYVDQFVVDCRRRVPLESLQEDLSLYLKTLQSAMIELINKDYADFVNLSTNLVGLDKAINGLKQPLGHLQGEILNAQNSMNEAILVVEKKLLLQEHIKEKKVKLQQLMSIGRCVDKIEKLLGIHADTGGPQLSCELTGQLIERVATEFNKLQFFVNKSRDLPLVDTIKLRIATITSTLQYSLEGSFKQGLEDNDVETLRQCLRTYATIDKMADAENLFRQYVVKPYMENIICEEFIQNDPKGLAGMYGNILDFIPKYCKSLKDITSGSTPGKEPVRGYDFIVNAVWPEIVINVEARVPSIFAPGNPQIFHQKYNLSMDFVERLEQCCGSQASVKRFRGHPSYNTFMCKWSLPVYFQIRFQEIAGTFETTLLNPFELKDKSIDGFYFNASYSAWKGLEKCWDKSIWLVSLSHRFWKLSLQILSRYASWIEEVKAAQKKELVEIESNIKTAKDAVANPEDPTKTSENLNVSQTVKLIADINSLKTKVDQLYKDVIKPCLIEIGIENISLLDECFVDSFDMISKYNPLFVDYILEDIGSQCQAYLKMVTETPRLYRRTNREVPGKASGYVQNSLKPVQLFLAEHSVMVTEDTRQEWVKQIINTLTDQYLLTVTDVLTSVKKMEESLKRLKRGKGSTAGIGGLTDDGKIRLQLYLDVQQFGKEIEQVNLVKTDINRFTELDELVTTAKNTSST